MARLLSVRSLHLSATNVHRSGMKELSGPTKGATEAACRPVPEGRNGDEVRLIPSSGYNKYSGKKATHLCTKLPLLCWIATMLEGLFGEYHSSSAVASKRTSSKHYTNARITRVHTSRSACNTASISEHKQHAGAATHMIAGDSYTVAAVRPQWGWKHYFPSYGDCHTASCLLMG